MSYKEKRTIASIVTMLSIVTAYYVYAFNKVQAGLAAPDDMKFWATTILTFIGIAIVASIVIQIIFHILLSIGIAAKSQLQNGKCDEKEVEREINQEMIEDEMDQLIELKAMRIGFAMAGIGFVAALVSVVLDYAPAIMLNILFLSFIVGSMIESVTQLYFYRRGIRNG
ncbi:MAG: hypothetical protein PHT29_05715 [Eubacteriales bacterium]|nr:hypothetical protein [Eubacteriales bacterium]MDD3290365.1 hypothetical protein [Eubacteriales bacterium]MDD3864270.1 hypothetical protein [Eubacteriales bacterium]MDD4444669.1 hypothetical protein [Eubacteriales bacterium]